MPPEPPSPGDAQIDADLTGTLLSEMRDVIALQPDKSKAALLAFFHLLEPPFLFETHFQFEKDGGFTLVLSVPS